MRTLCIDIGGTGIKMLTLDEHHDGASERQRERTPHPARPEAVLRVIGEMATAAPPFDRVSVGFPGVVVRGVVHTAPNLGTKWWRDFELAKVVTELLDKPVLVINDADLQGYGVIQSRGVEMVLTLGTGLGAALFTEGQLVPNLELGHHPFKKNKTYEQRISDTERKRVGNKRWRRRVREMVDQLEPIFNFDRLYIGGGNARLLRDSLGSKVTLFDNAEALKGGSRPWQQSAPTFWATR